MVTCQACGFPRNKLEHLSCRQCGAALERPASPPETVEDGVAFRGRFDAFVPTSVVDNGGDARYYVAHSTTRPTHLGSWVCEIPRTGYDRLADWHPEGESRIAVEAGNPFAGIVRVLSELNFGVPTPKLCVQTDDFAYLVVECPAVRQLTAVDRVTEAEAKRIGFDLCRIIQSLHERGIVHGRLDTDAFRLDPSGGVWLATYDTLHPAATSLEMVADLQAIGRVLYFLLTGRRLPSVRAGNRFLPAASDHLSPVLARILSRALAVKPIHRFDGVREFAEALATFTPRLVVRSGHCSDVGHHREINEDAVLVLALDQCFESVDMHVGLYAVADGMGGEAAGEVASRLALRAVAGCIVDRLIGGRIFAETERETLIVDDAPTWAPEISSGLETRDLMTEAFLRANRQILEYTEDHPSSEGMGTTLTAAIIADDMLTVGQIGDSRCYVLSRGILDRITDDHSLVERMVRRGELTARQARIHPFKNVIYRSIGGQEEIEIDIVTRRLQSGDVVLLCSDGLSGMLEDEEIHTILAGDDDPWRLARRLVSAANFAGGEDNISVVVLKIL